MANLLGQNIGLKYHGILNLGSTIDQILTTTAQAVTDGAGNTSPLQLATDSVTVGNTFNVSNTSAANFSGNIFANANIFQSGFIRGNWAAVPSGQANTTTLFYNTSGYLGLRLGTATGAALFNTSAITTSDKTFTFPNSSMTLAGLEIAQSFTANQTFQQYVYLSATGGPLIATQTLGDPYTVITSGAINGNNLFYYSGFNRDWPAPMHSFTGINMLYNAATSNSNPSGIAFFSATFGIQSASATVSEFRGLSAIYTINNTVSASGKTATGIYLNATETSLNSMTHNLIDLQVGGSSKFKVSNGGLVTTGSLIANANGAASTPSISLTGTWFSGGTTTNTTPQVLIQPTGAGAASWNTGGTALGINSASGFAGNLIAMYSNGTATFRVQTDSSILMGGGNARIQAVTSTSTGQSPVVSGASIAIYPANLNVGHGFMVYTPAITSIVSGDSGALKLTTSFTPAAGAASFQPINIAYTINASGAQTGTVTGIYARATETNLNGATHNLIDLGTGTTSIFSVSNVGVPNFNQTLASTSSGSSGNHLVIKVGATTYKIALLNN